MATPKPRGKAVRTFTKRADADAYARKQNTAIKRHKYKVQTRTKGFAVVKAPPFTIW